MTETEGVIKYHLNHRNQALSADFNLKLIEAWRTLLYKLELIGQDKNKYDGLGYGNISQRAAPNSNQFIITGTQTGHLAHLSTADYALITATSLAENQISSQGLSQPSSEALTHASVYRARPAVQAVIHVHCPAIWQQTDTLQLPHTQAEIRYGSVAMACAVQQLVQKQPGHCQLFSMLGHQDGIVSYGESLAAAGSILIETLAKAISLASSD